MVSYIILGDGSNDGHGKTKTFAIQHNLGSSKALEAAYKSGASLVGADLRTQCHRYEDGQLTHDFYEKLVEAGIKLDDITDPKEHYMGAEEFAELWLRITHLGNPGLTAQLQDINAIDIGGYGLFW